MKAVKILRQRVLRFDGAAAKHVETDIARDDDELDAAFYRYLYADINELDEAAARKHWLQHGRSEKRIANASSLPSDFDVVSYLYLNKDLDIAAFDGARAVRHYLEFGREEGRAYRLQNEDATFAAAYARIAGVGADQDRRIRWAPSAVEPYLHVSGLTSGAFLRRFDHRFYAEVYLQGEGNVDFPAALIHFVENGIRRLHPIAADLVFDVGFHRRQRRRDGLPGAALSDDALYRAWLSAFDLERFPSNEAGYMKARFGVACGRNDVVDLAFYRLANEDLRGLDDFALVEQLFTNGIFEQRSSIRISPSNAPLLARFARHIEARGEHEKAQALFERLIHACPGLAALHQQFADFLIRRERFAYAFRSYQRNIIAGEAGKRTFLNAAQCCERLNDLEGMLDVLAAGCRTYPDDEALLRRWQSVADRYFVDESACARAAALAGRLADGQAVLSAAAERCGLPASGAAPSRTIRSVGLVANLDLSQCNLYRVEQKIEQSEAAGLSVRLYDWRHDLAAFHGEMIDLDAVVFYRVAALPDVVRAMHAAQAAGLPTFFEVDDLVFDPQMFPEPLSDYAGQITPEHHVEIALGVPLFRKALELCDYAIASTPALARHMEPLVKRRRSFVHRNALGRRHAIAMAARREVAARADHPVTIFYGSGTKAHKLDFERILVPALEAVERSFGERVRLVVAGHPPVEIGEGVLSRARYVPFTAEVETYWAALREADIALSVLRRTPMTGAKSEIKWLEAAMFGIPSVVSATDTFEEVIEDGVDGYLAADTAAFVERISALVRDPARRRVMGEAARRKALRDYSIAPQAANLRAIFEAASTPAGERKRVLVVNVYYAPQAKGGATRVVIDNVRDLRALFPDEFELEVFTTLEGGERPYGVRVASHEGVRVTSMVAGDLPLGDDTAEDARAGEVFERCVERFRPHLIHFHCIQRITASAVQVARRRAIPYLITAHDGWWISDRQFLHDDKGPAPIYAFGVPTPLKAGPRDRNTRPATLRAALDGAEAVLAVSDSFAELYRSAGLANVRSVPNGVSPLTIDPSRRETRSPLSKVTLAHIGGLEAHKGFPLLRNAIVAAQPRNVTLLAVDLSLEPGDERTEMLGATAVRYIGRRRQSEMAALYRGIDVLFAPSLWPESFGLVTREAVASGCWVVASDRGAIADVVQDGINGHVVPVDDLGGLVAAIQAIDRDPARYLASPPPAPPMRTSQDQARELAELYRDLIPAAPA